MSYRHERAEARTAARDPLPAPVLDAMPPPDWGLLARFHAYLASRELSGDLALQNGWYPSSQARDGAPRIVIPAVASEGHTFWQARAMDGTEPKYHSPHHPRRDAFVRVWPYPARGQLTVMALTEGPMCALAVAGCGGAAIALMGATPPPAVLQHIAWRVTGLHLVLIPDTDALAAMYATGLYFAALGRSVELLHTAPDKDFADMPREERLKLWAR